MLDAIFVDPIVEPSPKVLGLVAEFDLISLGLAAEPDPRSVSLAENQIQYHWVWLQS
jgi:hypothetical protein